MAGATEDRVEVLEEKLGNFTGLIEKLDIVVKKVSALEDEKS